MSQSCLVQIRGDCHSLQWCGHKPQPLQRYEYVQRTNNMKRQTMCPTEGCWLPHCNFTFTTEEQDRRPSSLSAARYSMPLPVWMSSTTTLFWVVTEFEGPHRSSLSLSESTHPGGFHSFLGGNSLSLNYWPTAVLYCTPCGQMCSMGWGCFMPYWVVQVHPFGPQLLFEKSLAHDLGMEKEDFLLLFEHLHLEQH